MLAGPRRTWLAPVSDDEVPQPGGWRQDALDFVSAAMGRERAKVRDELAAARDVDFAFEELFREHGHPAAGSASSAAVEEDISLTQLLGEQIDMLDAFEESQALPQLESKAPFFDDAALDARRLQARGVVQVSLAPTPAPVPGEHRPSLVPQQSNRRRRRLAKVPWFFAGRPANARRRAYARFRARLRKQDAAADGSTLQGAGQLAESSSTSQAGSSGPVVLPEI